MMAVEDCKMLVKRYTQNYYEIHGTFDRIELSPVSVQLRQLADAVDMPINAYCLSLLGYPSDITSSDLEVYAHWQVYDWQWFVDKGITKTEDPDVIGQYVRDHGNTRKIIYRQKSYKSVNVDNAITMLTAYYTYNTDFKVSIGNSLLSTKDFITMLKATQGRLSLAKIMDSLTFSKLLVTFKKSDCDIISNGIFYYNSLTDRQLALVQREAISNIANGHYLVSGVIKDPLTLPFLPLNDNETYLSVLDMCRGLGITYAQYLQLYGINIVDQTAAVKEHTMVVTKTNNVLYITDLSSTEKNPVYQMDLAAFKSRGKLGNNELTNMGLF